jgi:hypothetical protein
MNEQKKALYYYLANQDKINEGHLGEFVAIYDGQVIEYYKDHLQGLKDMVSKGYKMGTFNINECHPAGVAAIDMGFISVVGDYL